MIALQSLVQLEDGRFYAKWFDADDTCGLGHTIAALHHADGRLDVANLNIRAPRLTAEQMSQAQPFTEPQHPAYALAEKGTAVRPDWAKRYEKAADLVAEGAVRLTGPDTAVVTGSSDIYTISNDKCHCKWVTFNSDPCSHYLAVRMARALGQAIESATEAEKEAACEARRLANRDAMARRIADRGENKYYKDRRQARQDGDGARQWARMAMANGRQTIPTHIYDRATGGGGSS